MKKDPGKRKRIMLLFSKVYIFRNINYNLSPAKTLSAITRNKNSYLLCIAACAAAKRAIGTRNGEHDT